MDYKEIKVFKAEDGELFDTNEGALDYCGLINLKEEYTNIWLNSYLDFEELYHETDVGDLVDVIAIFNRIVEHKEK